MDNPEPSLGVPDWLSGLPVPALAFRDGEVIAVNAAAELLFDRPRAALVGTGFADALLDDEDASHLNDELDRAVRRGEARVVVRLGSTPPVRFFDVVLVGDADGIVTAWPHEITDHARLDSLTAMFMLGALTVGTDRRITWVAPSTAAGLGVDAGLLSGLDVVTLAHPEDRPAFERLIEDLRAQPGTQHVTQVRIRHPLMEDVHWPLQIYGTYLPDDPAIGGFAARLHLLMTDTEPLEGAAADFPTLAESVPIGMIAATVEDRLTFCNGLARALVGPIDPRDALGWVDLARAESRSDLHRIVANARQGRGREFVVAGFDRPDGTTRWLRVEAVPQADRRGVPSGWLVTLLDLTSETMARQQLQQAQDQLWHLANHDPLTGLPNRMLFSDRLEVALARNERSAGHEVAVLYCDLDAFKPVNDRYGHDAGDRVLQVVARRLGAEVRATDTVCRFGGDEFVVLCEAFGSLHELERIAGRLIGATHDPVDAGDVRARVGLSVGIAIATPGEGAIPLLSRADGALYAAKTDGGGRFAVAR